MIETFIISQDPCLIIQIRSQLFNGTMDIAILAVVGNRLISIARKHLEGAWNDYELEILTTTNEGLVQVGRISIIPPACSCGR